ncbi:hypothetical protein PGT21_004606 [Puccinia graminis f. sp. tritici]|uniref:Uncharacterized protein n=1 Tax=Puccinia graminis f. sp. tritici TaxID=56615 RepID=A0A5B0PP82_PUCGR|nr:hypothetical protein PGT21_003411 [Puccinia graminis f. sp. tritici]KAA1103031.1 hypothetical protein PGT21_004606 [Puccinia graminis f. sp. tritici]
MARGEKGDFAYFMQVHPAAPYPASHYHSLPIGSQTTPTDRKLNQTRQKEERTRGRVFVGITTIVGGRNHAAGLRSGRSALLVIHLVLSHPRLSVFRRTLNRLVRANVALDLSTSLLTSQEEEQEEGEGETGIAKGEDEAYIREIEEESRSAKQRAEILNGFLNPSSSSSSTTTIGPCSSSNKITKLATVRFKTFSSNSATGSACSTRFIPQSTDPFWMTTS